MSKKIVTRFAPSPTGYLHIGGLRTALFCFLVAKNKKGTFRLRIEDTDQKREVEGAAEHLIRILISLGLEPNGKIVVQSENSAKGVYAKAAEKLLTKKHSYRCFCTEDRLEDLRKEQEGKKLPPRYDGACRNLSKADIEKRLGVHDPFVIRLMLPEENRTIEALDGVHGTMRFETHTLADTVLLKSDGFPTYHLANVVDDHDMGITHVIRGEEWIPSLPLHLMLYEYLGFGAPLFYHLPLILNPDRSKLSKRQGHVSVEWYLEQGYLPGAILNYIAFLGWNPGDDREIFSLEELIHHFDLAKLNKAGAVFSIDKLNWYNNWYIKNILAPQNPDELASSLKRFLPDENDERRIMIFNVFFERIHALIELPKLWSELRDLPDYPASLLIFRKSTREKTRAGLEVALEFFKSYTGAWKSIALDVELKKAMQDHSLSFGDVYWPVRVSLSGAEASPSPTELAALLGKEESVSRIALALKKLH